MNRKKNLQRMSLWLQALAYTGAGVNHFLHSDSYIQLIPPYFPYIPEINIVAGITEIVLGISLVVVPAKRKWISMGIILMLIAFLPSHIYHVQMGGNIPGSAFIMPLWAAWLRLGLQFGLMLWAWSVRKYRF